MMTIFDHVGATFGRHENIVGHLGSAHLGYLRRFAERELAVITTRLECPPWPSWFFLARILGPFGRLFAPS